MEEINLDNYLSLNIQDITLNRNKLGELVFESINLELVDLQSVFKQFDELNYHKYLLPAQVMRVDELKRQFIEELNKIRTFELTQPDAKLVHDALETSIRNFYTSAIEQLRNYLVYLRQEAELESKDQKELQKQIKETTNVRAQLEASLKQFQKEYRAITREKDKVARSKGELASKVLATHFDNEAKDFENSANKWLRNRTLFFWSLMVVIIVNILLFTFLKTGFWFFEKDDAEDVFNTQYLVVKATLVLLLSYGIAFASKNYRVNSNLAVINRHRRSVAQTIEDYLGTNPRQEIQDQIIKEGVSAMFKHVNAGYLSGKEVAGDNAPTVELINNIAKPLVNRSSPER